MANNESTAVNALIAHLHQRPIERDSEPALELFVPRARAQSKTFPEAIVAIPSVVPAPAVARVTAAPVRHARGTDAPPIAPLIAHDDEDQTALWTAPPEPPVAVALPVREVRAAPPRDPRVDAAAAERSRVRVTTAESARSRAISIVTPSPTSHLIAKELMSSAVRYAGLGLVAVVALGIGVYLAVRTGSSEPEAPTERDRAVAIMTGAPLPEAVPLPAEVPAAVQPAKAPAPVVTPIEPAVTTPAPEPAAVTTPAPAAEPTPAPVAEAAADEIEMAPAVTKPKRTARKAQVIARTSKTEVAKIKPEAKIKPSRSKPESDPVLAAIHGKPEPKVKPSKSAPTEIPAPRGAAPQQGSGQVAIASNVSALIFLDGRPTGKTSPTSLVIPAGDHQITLLDPATKKAKTATIQIAANKTISVRKEFN